jgi:toxin-antitoxin system PIN domain toxin
MIMADVNVLVYAFRRDSDKHELCRDWLQKALEGPENFGYSDFVLSSVVRVATHPRVFKSPSPLEAAFEFTDAIWTAPPSVAVHPGPMHWAFFRRLCIDAEAKGNLVPDAYLAALAIEQGARWVSSDRDFARFDGLRWELPG